jgi:hypothetical protein
LEIEICKQGLKNDAIKWAVWGRKGHQKYANWNYERDALELEAEYSRALSIKEKLTENSKIP